MGRAAVLRWMVVGSVASGATPLAADRFQTEAVVRVALDDPDGQVTESQAQVEPLVTAIYAAAGVTVVWQPVPAGGAGRTLTITLTTSRPDSGGPRGDALGVAPSPGDGTRGTHARRVNRGMALPFSSTSADDTRLGPARHVLRPPRTHR